MKKLIPLAFLGLAGCASPEAIDSIDRLSGYHGKSCAQLGAAHGQAKVDIERAEIAEAIETGLRAVAAGGAALICAPFVPPFGSIACGGGAAVISDATDKDRTAEPRRREYDTASLYVAKRCPLPGPTAAVLEPGDDDD